MADGPQALRGINVLDFGRRASTAWCGRLLADQGATVVGVEPSPHPLRQEGPFCAATDDSLPARYLLASRELVHAASDSDRALAHVVLIDQPADAERWRDAHPHAIVCLITPWGADEGERPGNDLTACAAGGWAYVNGLQGRAPLKSSGYQASYQTGMFAYGVIVAALIEQLANHAPGQVIEISEEDVLVSTASPAPLRWQYSGFKWARRAGVDMNEGPVPVADGWFALTISRPAFWQKAMHVLGLPDLAEDPELQQSGLRHKFKDRFVDRVGQAMAGWQRMDLFDALGAQRVIAGPVLTMDELADNPQFEARDFFVAAEDGVRYPGSSARYGKLSMRQPFVRTEPNDGPAFAADAMPLAVQPVRAVPTTAGAHETQRSGPLSGFRGLVLTQAWAGTYATQLLGLLGADVIQLETRGRLDSWRGTYQNPIPKHLQGVATAQHAWNVSPLYNSVNLNKRCITVDLAEPDGVQLFKSLVCQADFVAENFSPRVMGNLGIDYPRLCALRPDLVMASLSAYGAVGPWAPVPGIGGTIEPSSGMSALLGYDGEHPMNSGQMYPDPVAGLCGFAAIATALLHRDRTGVGQYIDLSMQEANFTFVGDAWLEYAYNGTVRGPMGNRHASIAPHGIYPTNADDAWIAVSADTDAQWRALCQVLGLPSNPDWSRAERLARRAEIDAALSTALSGQPRDEVAARLIAARIPAAAVLSPDEIAQSGRLRAKGTLVPVDHPEAGRHLQAGLPAKLSRTPGGVTRPAPLQGEHSFEVFAELLGMSAGDYETLCTRGVTGVGPSPKSTVANQA